LLFTNATCARYAAIIHPNNTYAVLIDNEVKESGDLEEHWDFLAPKTIKDPDATKPEEWDERAMIPDEADVKPEGHDDIPEMIVDPAATKPEDWDDEDDGEWEAPTVANPEFKGAWWGCTRRIQFTHSLKGAWLQPLRL
jgi:calreticulin